MRWIFGLVGLWLALGATPALADSLTVHDEDRWRGTTVWPRSSVLDTATGDNVTMSEVPGRLSITARSNIEYLNFQLSFEGPGQAGRLERGVYPDAQPAYERQLDHPGLGFDASYYYGWSDCDRPRASFEVLDIARDAADRVTRVWIVWERHCSGQMGSFFGEVRVGMPAAAGPRVVPSQVRFPEGERGGTSITVPVKVHGGGTNARIVGDDFEIVSDTCDGKPDCEVQVRAVPSTAGERTAKLRVTDAAGKDTDVPLEIFAHGGTTGYTMDSDPGEWVGDGKSWTYGPGSRIDMGGSRHRLVGRITDPAGGYWYLEFSAGDGDVLAAGTTYRGTSGSGTGSRFQTFGMGRACDLWRGTFTVHELAFDELDLTRARISYEMECLLDPGLFLRGTFSWHAGDDAAPARWMVPSSPAVAPAPLPARTASVTFSHEGGWRSVWDAQAGDRITLDTSGGGLKVDAAPGSEAQPISLVFYTPPTNGGVKPGVYAHAGRNSSGPLMEVRVDGNTVGEADASFEVREFEQIGGVVTRAWILFEVSDGDRTHSGEVRIGMPPVDGPRSAPTRLRYGAVELGEPGVASLVAFWPKDGAKITDVRLLGDNAADAQIRVDECTGAPVVAGEPCSVYVRFSPSAAGVRRATLRATDTAGRVTEVPLEIFARGGNTSYQVTSTMRPTREGLSPVLPPGTRTYDTKADYGVTGDDSRLHVDFLANLNNLWTMDFAPPKGQALQVGRYADAQYYVDRGDSAGLNVRIGVECQHLTGEFTVLELVREFGITTRAKVSFEYSCPEFTGTLSGTVAWRAGDSTPLAPWMVSSDGNPTPTPTPTVSPTPTPSPSPTPSPTATATATPSPTATPTATPSPTPTPTTSPSPTATPTATPTSVPSPTATSTASPSPTSTPTASPTPTPSQTATPTSTIAPGRTATPTPSPTDLPTATPTPDPSLGPPTPFRAAPSPTPSAPTPRAVVRAKLEPCRVQATTLARVASSHRRAAATRFAKRLETCRRDVFALPKSAARSAALTTLRRYASAAHTLRSKRASAKDVRRARTLLSRR